MPSRPSSGTVAPRRKTADLEHPGERTPAPDHGAADAPDLKTDRPEPRPRTRPRIVVRGEVAPASGPGLSLPIAPSDYPVQLGKVQAPPLRDDTLARDRLLEWLSVKIHSRVVLLVAEAGYGKTTLLADFSRRTRTRVLWFRLDRGDRDWVGFLAHLVAAVRVHQPGFGASTSALLRGTGTASPPLDAVLDAFIRELASMQGDATAFVFDDLHLVDDAPDVRNILRELLARAPDRMSFVFATRREPPLRLARFRALGEIAELRTNDLRFDVVETERLFREAYDMPLEPSVLAELNKRTEGWAASLQLVRAAIHDRDAAQVRSFVASLSGAEGHLYEYLAEEVIGDLPEPLQQFLMRTSVLDTVDLTLGPVAADLGIDETRGLIEEAERHGLLGRGGPGSRSLARAHPLVRDFLQDRLVRAVGDTGMQDIHARVGMAAESVDWQKAARHYHAAGRDDDARRVLESSIEVILANGAYAAAQDVVTALGRESIDGVAGLVLASRLAQQRGARSDGLALAEQAHAADPASVVGLLNLVAARTLVGDVPGAFEASKQLEASGAALAGLARSFSLTLASSVNGSLDDAVRELRRQALELRGSGASHYLGVCLLNLSNCELAMGNFADALASADEATTLLGSSSTGVELVSARLARAAALAFRGDLHLARLEMQIAASSARPVQADELAFEIGQIEALLGSPDLAWPVIDRPEVGLSANVDHGEQVLVARSLLRVRAEDMAGAAQELTALRFGVARSTMAFESRRHLTRGLVLHLAGGGAARAELTEGVRIAEAQQAHLWVRYGRTLLALADDVDPSPTIHVIAAEVPVVLSMAAEAVLQRLTSLTPQAQAEVLAEARARPERWGDGLRRIGTGGSPDARRAAAFFLAEVGDRSDVARLREIERSLRDREIGRLAVELARRLADRVIVEDLGRVEVHVGSRVVDGTEVRRKVLGLLCLLVSKPGFAATREEVLDCLWPEHDPAAALNSLNQTVYFLRRLFEPTFEDATSPGYIGQDGETVWLDAKLVTSRSRQCLDLIRRGETGHEPDLAVRLAQQYRGRFALDFAYDEWASAYRDSLHAGYLRVMEQAIRADLDSGHLGRGIFVGERAAEVDPDSEQIQIALVRLYRISGAHAAAAEQYAHYARAMEELGVEPTAFSDV